MGQRAYRRDANGKFAGSGGGTSTTYGKAGGFANAAFRARTASTNQKASRGKSFALGQSSRKAGRAAIRFSKSAGGRQAIKTAAGAAGAVAAYSAVRSTRPTLATVLNGGRSRGSRRFNTSVNL